MKLFGNSKTDVLGQIRSEYDYGFASCDPVRQQRREDLELYFDSQADDSKVRIRTIFQNHRMLMAIAWANRPKIEWKRRRNGDYERAMNANRVMKFDYKEMSLGSQDYEMESDRFLKWVGIQASDGFDVNRTVPKIRTIDPLCAILDPDGGPTIESHRFIGFEVRMTKNEMKNLGFENLDSVTQKTPNQAVQKEKEAGGITDTPDDTPNKLYDVYVHFTQIGNKKYRAITNWEISEVLSFEYLNPVLEEEKADESLVCYPVTLKYYFWIRWRVMGLSVPDLNRDSQSAISKLFNLYLAMAYRNTFGGDRLVRADQLEDPASLETPTIEGKDIPVTASAGALNDIIYELPRESTNAIPTNMIEMLRANAENIIGANAVQQGVSGQNDATLGELQMAQQNGNLQFLLMENVWVWAEEFKWKYLWYRQYVANMKRTERKQVSLSEGFTQEFFAFRKDDFIGKEMLALEVVSSGEEKSKRTENKAGKIFILQQQYATAKTETEKAIIMREWMELESVPAERIMERAPKTKDEIGAEEKLVLINNDDMLGAEIDSMDDDHNAYIRIFQTADSNKTKKEAIKRRYEAMTVVGQMQEAVQNPAVNAGVSASTSQMASNMIQANSSQPSLQDVTA